MRRACRLWSKPRPSARRRVVERLFAGVAERGMADVMRQRESFGEIRIQAESVREGARDLGHFQRVSEAAAEVVAGRIAWAGG